MTVIAHECRSFMIMFEIHVGIYTLVFMLKIIQYFKTKRRVDMLTLIS